MGVIAAGVGSESFLLVCREVRLTLFLLSQESRKGSWISDEKQGIMMKTLRKIVLSAVVVVLAYDILLPYSFWDIFFSFLATDTSFMQLFNTL